MKPGGKVVWRYKRSVPLTPSPIVVGDELYTVSDNGIATCLEAVTGKPSGNDLKEHKVTLPLIAALPQMSRAQRERVERLFADPTPSDASIAEVVGIVTECGGLDFARQKGEEFAEEAEEVLGGLPASEVRQALVDVLGYVMDRRS